VTFRIAAIATKIYSLMYEQWSLKENYHRKKSQSWQLMMLFSQRK